MPDQTDIYISSFPDAESISNTDKVTGLQGGANKNFKFSSILSWVINSLLSAFVPVSRTINGKGLSSNISLTATDVGARPDTWTPSAADVGLGNVANERQYSALNPPPLPTPSDIGAQSTITASGILKGDGAGGVSAATAGTDYQAPLTFDNTPTANSTNPVQSGGVYTDVRTRVPNYGKGKNLLRNWYFVGGGTGRGVFPVNQRENVTLTVSNATRYFVDGWRANGTFTLSLSTNGLTIAATGQVYFQQFLSDILPWGKSITASMLTTDGITTFSGNLPASKPAASTVILSATDGKGRFALINDAANMLNLQIRTDSTTRTVIAVKLELGTEQTLAHQKNSAWVLNEIPDYEYELYRCITSTADSSDTYANKSLATEQQLADVENGTTASRAYSIGELFCRNGLLYRAKKGILSGGTFTPGTNCEPTTVENEVYSSVARKRTFTVPANGSLDIVNATGQYSYLLFAVNTNAAAAGAWIIMSRSTATTSRIIQQLYTPSSPVTSIASRSCGITITNGSSEDLNISIIADADGFYKP